MVTVNDAILAIRAAVQDYGDERTRIGEAAPLEEVAWVGSLLGWEWPRSYLDLIAKHDGVRVRRAYMPDFFSAFRLLSIYRDPWHRLRYWPVAADGCGDYWVLALAEGRGGECPVYFLDHDTEQDMSAPTHVAAESLAAFVVDYMTGLWVRGDD